MKVLILLIAASLLSGCQYRSYKEGNASYTSISLGTTQQIAPFKVTIDKDGSRTFQSQGLSSDQTNLVESAVGAAVKAAIKP